MRAYLQAEGIIAGSSKVVVSGISRGGFLATHYALSASTDKRTPIHAVGLFSPVTNLSLLTEFSVPPEPPAAQAKLRLTDLEAFSSQLSERLNVFAIIGDEDTRVYTNSLVKLMRAVQCDRCQDGEFAWAGCTKCVASPRGRNRFTVEFEPEGHTVPPHEAPQIAFGEFERFVLRLSSTRRPNK